MTLIINPFIIFSVRRLVVMIDFVKVGFKIIKYRKEQNLTQDDIA